MKNDVPLYYTLLATVAGALIGFGLVVIGSSAIREATSGPWGLVTTFFIIVGCAWVGQTIGAVADGVRYFARHPDREQQHD